MNETRINKMLKEGIEKGLFEKTSETQYRMTQKFLHRRTEVAKEIFKTSKPKSVESGIMDVNILTIMEFLDRPCTTKEVTEFIQLIDGWDKHNEEVWEQTHKG